MESAHQKGKQGKEEAMAFGGFHTPTSNTTYTPNQFFDVCLRNSSRGTVRLVSYVIRKTLGWCDEDGIPQEDRIRTPYEELCSKAGISRDMIRQSIDEALDRNFLRCVREGKKSRAGVSPTSGLYELKWWDAEEYDTDPDAFEGFFEGKGNRTYIPNQFFDEIVPNEPLAVIKVVGSVIRSSIGYEAKRGHRRQDAHLSFTQLQRFTGIKSRATLSEAIKTAISKGYIKVLEEGVFHPDKRQQRSSVYALCWADSFTGQKTEPENLQSEKRTSPKNEPGIQSDSRTRTGQNSEPEDQSESRTSIKIKPKNKTQQNVGSAFLRKKQLLLDEGLNPSAAERLARNHSVEEIQRQIDWIDLRNPKDRAALLKAAIEQNFAAPKRWNERKEHREPQANRLLSQIEGQLDRDAHMQRHRDAYLTFLRREDARIRQKAPERYGQFITVRENEARVAAEKPWADASYLDKFNSENSFLEALQIHFRLQDFWQWDRTLNPTPFESLAAKMSLSIPSKFARS